MSRQIRIIVLLVVLALTGAACGQKSGVAGQNLAAGAAGGGGELGEGTVAGDAGGASGTDAGATTDTGAAPGGGGVDAGAAAAGGGTGGGAAGTAGAGATATGGGGSTGGTAAGPGDRTGISDKEIVIGIHAPVTGAAPFPANSFNVGKDIYWKFLAERGGVHGRNVRVVFRDDQFNPSRAVQVCREMVEKEKAFLLVGGGGADQITACAKYANGAGVPYLSAGVNEAGLSNLRSYFALSMTYAQQSPLLAGVIKNIVKKTKVGVVVADTPSFQDGKASFVAAAKAAGLQIVYDKPYPKNASQSDALSVANALRTAGAEAVYVLTSPTSFIYLAQAANGQAYNPAYVGPGITAGLNQVTEFGCPGVSGARFLSPFPQIDRVNQMDPNYGAAYAKYGQGNEADDIGLAMWSLSKTLHQMFDAAGKDMSRQSFVTTLESGRAFASGLFPPVKYGPGKHLGANQAHLLQADCGARQYKTTHVFASGF